MAQGLDLASPVARDAPRPAVILSDSPAWRDLQIKGLDWFGRRLAPPRKRPGAPDNCYGMVRQVAIRACDGQVLILDEGLEGRARQGLEQEAGGGLWQGGKGASVRMAGIGA